MKFEFSYLDIFDNDKIVFDESENLLYFSLAL